MSGKKRKKKPKPAKPKPDVAGVRYNASKLIDDRDFL